MIAAALLAVALSPALPVEAHRAEIEAWRAVRLERLVRPDG